MIDPVFVHYDYPVLEEDPVCSCRLCADQRRALLAVREFQAEHVNPIAHPVGCRCELCQAQRLLERQHLAAANRRDTYSELTFLVRDKDWRHPFLRWAHTKIVDIYDRVDNPSGRTDDWWIRKAEQKSLATWIEDWVQTLPAGRLAAGSRLLSIGVTRRRRVNALPESPDDD